jgi:hypothetical protein
VSVGPLAAGNYTYEVIAWGNNTFGRSEANIVGGSISTLWQWDKNCATVDDCVEYDIRAGIDEIRADGPYSNHGEYVRRVAQWVESFGLDPEGQSCLVNPEARSNVGKPTK